MKNKIILLVGMLMLVPGPLMAEGTAFTYQGHLITGTNPTSGLYEMQFTLFDAATNGAPVGAPVSVAPVAVSNGLFTVLLDFGPHKQSIGVTSRQSTITLHRSSNCQMSRCDPDVTDASERGDEKR